MILPRNLRVTRRHTGGEEHFVIGAGNQCGRLGTGVEVHIDAGDFELAPEVLEHLVKLLFARNACRHVELAADLVGRLEQMDLMTPFAQHGGGSDAGSPGADHGELAPLRRWPVDQLGLVARTRIDQAARHFLREDVVEAGLIAANTDIDLVAAALCRLVDEFRVGEEGPRHRHHVRTTIGQHLFGHLGHVDAVGRDDWNANFWFELLREPRPCCARYAGRDGRHPRLVPADTGVDDRGAGLFDGLGELHHLAPHTPARHQINQ